MPKERERSGKVGEIEREEKQGRKRKNNEFTRMGKVCIRNKENMEREESNTKGEEMVKRRKNRK